jgi:hypothetical protein
MLNWGRGRAGPFLCAPYFFIGTSQPPLPLQLFFPAHPLSPVLQPPWPLQPFWPLQACFSAVAHPPWPLQLFFPAQPLSPVLQPPWPLQAFMPLQACFSASVWGVGLGEQPPRRAPMLRPPAAAPISFPNSRRSILGFFTLSSILNGLQDAPPRSSSRAALGAQQVVVGGYSRFREHRAVVRQYFASESLEYWPTIAC